MCDKYALCFRKKAPYVRLRKNVQYVGGYDSIDTMIRAWKPDSAIGKFHPRPLAVGCDSVLGEVDHDRADIATAVVRRRGQLLPKQTCSELTRPAAELKYALGTLEVRVGNQVIDAGIFVKTLAVQSLAESIVERLRRRRAQHSFLVVQTGASILSTIQLLVRFAAPGGFDMLHANRCNTCPPESVGT